MPFLSSSIVYLASFLHCKAIQYIVSVCSQLFPVPVGCPIPPFPFPPLSVFASFCLTLSCVLFHYLLTFYFQRFLSFPLSSFSIAFFVRHFSRHRRAFIPRRLRNHLYMTSLSLSFLAYVAVTICLSCSFVSSLSFVSLGIPFSFIARKTSAILYVCLCRIVDASLVLGLVSETSIFLSLNLTSQNRDEIVIVIDGRNDQQKDETTR